MRLGFIVVHTLISQTSNLFLSMSYYVTYTYIYMILFFVETLQGEPEIQLLQLHDQSI